MSNHVIRTVLFDVDGTLVDSNDAHARAWVTAFEESGIRAAFEAVRRCIGMGGDKLMPAVAGIDADSPAGKRISKRRGEIFRSAYLAALQPFRDAGRLVNTLQSRGLTAVAASSAKKDELEALLKIAGASSLIGRAASGDDAAESKPDPDIIHAALEKAAAPHAPKASPGLAVMIGDTPYDIEAASRAGVNAIAFRCGGWDDKALGGAVAIYDGPWDLLARLEDSPFATRNP